MSVGLVVQNSLRNRLAIVCAVTDEGLKRGDDLGEQIRDGRGIADFRRGELAGKNLDEWHQEKHDVPARRTWRKLHLAIDEHHSSLP